MLIFSEVAATVRAERARKRLTQKELSALSGVPKNFISLIETENLLPTEEQAEALLDALKSAEEKGRKP